MTYFRLDFNELRPLGRTIGRKSMHLKNGIDLFQWMFNFRSSRSINKIK